MTEIMKKKWRAMAGNTRLLILITTIVTAFAITTMIVNAVLLDSDGDNMSDTYEQLFGLNPADDSDAAFNYDDDTLNNLAEFGVSTDPWSSDTDRDGWYDDVDNVPLSRLYIEWGNAAFTTGDDFIYTGPAWWLSAFRTGGLWQTNPPAWTVASTEADGVGNLCIEIDRGVQTNDLVMSLFLHDHAGSSLGIDLLDVSGSVVAADLYGNILSGTDSDIELKRSIPLQDNTSASVIRLFRTTGEITVYETLLYVDDDGDGLDSDQEIQVGTSDQLADSDGDGLNDAEEVNIHETSPLSNDTDGDGCWDGWEILSGYNALVATESPVIARSLISAGNTHSMMCLPDGTVITCGDNGGGRTGQNTTISFLSVMTRVLSADGVSTLSGIESVTAGDEYSLAMQQAQTVTAWGRNGYGQLGDGSTAMRLLPVGTHGPEDQGYLSDVITIAAGHQHSLAIRQDGRLWAWGKNGSGQLGDGTTSGKHYPIPVHGEGGKGQLDGVLSVAAGYNHSLALSADGRVLAWGANGKGQLGDGTSVNHKTANAVRSADGTCDLTNIVAIAAGNYFSAALDANGAVWTWGWNDSGRLGDGTSVKHELPIRVHGVDDVGYLENIIAIALGHNHSLALASDGRVYAWGSGGVGKLGDNATANRKTPVHVLDPAGTGHLSNITEIAAADGHSLALSGAYRLYAWGNNGNGRLGDGTTTNRKLPVLVDSDNDGLPDPWEMMYFSVLTHEPTGDPDADNLTNLQELDFGTDPDESDTDGDSFDDDEEIAEGSDPLDANSVPVPLADISGIITYTGPQTGVVYVGVAPSFNSWALTNTIMLTSPEAYTLTNVLGETSQWIKAWRDSDADGSNDFWEAAGSYTSNPAYLTNDITGVNIMLSDPDTDNDGLPDWWEMLHFGTLSFGPGDDTDGDGLTNQAEFQLGTNPAEADSDGDGMDDGDEVALGKDPNSGNLFKQLPFIERFEADTVTVGDLHGQNNWDALAPDGNIVASGEVVVQTNTVYAGLCSFELNAETEEAQVRQTFVDPNSDVIWLDIRYMVIASETPTNDPVGSATFNFNAELNLVVYDGLQPAGTRWMTLTNHVPVETEEWVRLTVRLDYAAQQWLLCLNGILVADGLGFASYTEKLTQLAIVGQRGYADNIGLSTTVPDGINLDGDLMPDNWEEEYFGHQDRDGNGDYDGDGLSDALEYRYGTDPLIADTDGDGVSDFAEIQWNSNPNSSNVFDTVPWSTGFEFADGYSTGPVDGQQGWAVLSGSAVIDPSSGIDGTQGLQMQTGANGQCAVGRLFAGESENTIWTHFKLHTASGSLPSKIATGATAVMAIDPNGLWSARSGNQWIESNAGVLPDWTHVTVKEDFVTRKWSLYLGKNSLFSNLDFADTNATSFSRFAFFGSSDTPMQLDNVNIAFTAPGHIDIDGDGLTNDEELNYRSPTHPELALDPLSSDTDGDGMPDGLELLLGFDPLVSNSFFRIDENSGTNTWSTSFEPAEGYSIGLLNGQNGWIASNGVQVVDTMSHDGVQSVLMTGSGSTNANTEEVMGNIGAEGRDLVWFTLYYHIQQEVPADSQRTNETQSAVFYLGEDRLHAYDGILNDWVISERTFGSTSNAWRTIQGLGDGWHRFDVQLDYIQKIYRVCVDGIMALDNVNFKDADAPHLTSVHISTQGDNSNETHIDSIRISTEEPDGLDFDGDGLSNDLERQLGSNPEELDSDGDGISDADEVNIYGTNPAEADSDGDGMPDGWEIDNNFNPTNSVDGAADADGDGLSNAAEYAAGTSHTSYDTDGDGLSDGDEVNIHSTNPLVADTDGDGLSDGDEINAISVFGLPSALNPLDVDTDSDGYTDGFEIDAGTDPTDPSSNPLGDWEHHLRIHVRDIGITSALTNVQVLVTLNSERIDYSQMASDGSDLRFSDPTGIELPYEIQTWNPTGDSIIWLRIPEIPAAGSSVYILMHWGNANAPIAQNSMAVWSNAYDSVWHFEDSNETLLDVASDKHATDFGTDSVDGHLGKARDFNGADRISISPVALDCVSNAVSFSLWQFGDNIQPQNDYLFYGESPVGREFSVSMPWDDKNVYWDAFGNYDRIYKIADAEAWKGQWNHWTFTRDGGNMAIYLNGELWHSGSGKTRTYTALSIFNIGADADGNNNYDGIIDEFRIAGTAHSSDWIKAQYLSMTDALLRFGDQTVSLIAPTDAVEPHTDGSVTITRGDSPTDRSISVGVTISGSATPGSDYVALSDTAIIPAGDAQTTLPILVLDDDQFDGDETIVITLKDGDYLVAGTNKVAITINDDEEDSDSDGMPDAWEMNVFGTLTQRAADDNDNDGLTNAEEYEAGTDPLSGDTDADGLPDGWEQHNGLNPTINDASADPDGDGLTNAEEFQYGFDPNDGIVDNDQDGLADADEICLFGTSPLSVDTDADGTNDVYNVFVIDGTNTTHRNGLWTNQATTLVALDNHYMRAEYTISIAEAGMYLFDLDITNTYTQAISNVTFRLQFLIDNIPIGWIEKTSSNLSLHPSYLTTPWLTSGEHTIRLAWLDDYADDKLLGIENVILKRVDGADFDLSGVPDWEEWVLEQGCDTDADGLSDLDELNSTLEPLTSDSDGDTLGDGEELNIFGTDPLTADSNANGIPDAVLIATRKGTQTSYRQVGHITRVWKEDGNTLYNPKSGMLISYDFTVTNSGMYSVAFDLRNYKADAPDNYRFNVRIYVNGFSVGTQYVFADLDFEGTGTADIITPWLTPGTHSISLYWLNDSDTSGRVTTIAVDEVRLYGFDSPDADGDGIQDWQEEVLQNDGDTDGDGISDYDEITIYGTSPVLKDTDGDGLTDGYEVAYGDSPSAPGVPLNPTSVDTDSDAVSDYEEIFLFYTDPLFADFGGVVVPVADPGAGNFSASSGEWQNRGGSAVCFSRGGYIEYAMTLPEGGHYALDLLVRQYNSLSDIDAFDLSVSVDGVDLDRFTIQVGENRTGQRLLPLPYLSAGTHQVSIRWNNPIGSSTLAIDRCRIVDLGGVDANMNDLPDWVDNLLSALTLDAIPDQLLTSPICLEGESWSAGAVSVSSSYVLEGGSTDSVVRLIDNDGWFSDVLLSPTNETHITVIGDNGFITWSTNLTWATFDPFDPAHAGVSEIRCNDALLFGGTPPVGMMSNSVLDVTLTLDGIYVTNLVSEAGESIPFVFENEGTYDLVSIWDDQVYTLCSTVSVDVIDATFGSDITCLVGTRRDWSCPAIPATLATIDHDPELSLSREATPEGGTEFSLLSYALGKHHAVARISDNGPILDVSQVNVVQFDTTSFGTLDTIEIYTDGSRLVEVSIWLSEVPSNLRIEIDVFMGGVYFDDGTLYRVLTAEDFDEYGQYRFRLIQGANVSSSVCHRIRIYQGDTLIGP